MSVPETEHEAERPSAEEAHRFLAESSFVWHQRFQLVPGVYTPGSNDMEWIFRVAGVPLDLSGKTAIDIGTSNGGVAFELERRGAERVVAVDIFPPSWFGFDAIKEFLASDAEFVQASVYELPALLREEFDVLVFWGVLYHLRHPLLALDAIRALLRGTGFLETAVCDREVGELSSVPLVRFYRRDELYNDTSNWFAPTVSAFVDLCRSSGLDPKVLGAWPKEAPQRTMLKVTRTPGNPEYHALSYERPLKCPPSSRRTAALLLKRRYVRALAGLVQSGSERFGSRP
jgi:tRNA (mo5U34)-methyltransferase